MAWLRRTVLIWPLLLVLGAALALPGRPWAAAQQSAVTLSGVSVSKESVAPGETVTVTFSWSKSEGTGDVSVEVRVLNPSGGVYAQEPVTLQGAGPGTAAVDPTGLTARFPRPPR